MNPVLQKLGLSPERARIAAALIGKARVGRRGLPAEAVRRMYWDYRRLGSTYKVGKLYGRSAQAIHEMFSRRGLALKPDSRERRGRTRSWNGRLFTWGKLGWRQTSGERALLHHLIWEEAHGPIPAGHQVTCRNGDFEDLRPENLLCGTASQITRHHLRRRFPHLKLSAEAQRARRKKVALARYYRRRKTFWERGLRSDGRPLTRDFKKRMRGVPNYFPPVPPRRDEKDLKGESVAAPPVAEMGTVEMAWRQFREAADAPGEPPARENQKL